VQQCGTPASKAPQPRRNYADGLSHHQKRIAPAMNARTSHTHYYAHGKPAEDHSHTLRKRIKYA
jgi:hypothetical protein